ncbi:hypothetical protein L1887_14470 [Cichorium endivia]|nr:hypothetical protein L1887_14470 [Cichorium endivia]
MSVVLSSNEKVKRKAGNFLFKGRTTLRVQALCLEDCRFSELQPCSDGGGAAFYHLSPWLSSAKPPNAAFNHSQGEEWKNCQCYKLIKGLALHELFHYRDYEQLDLFKKGNVLMVIAHLDDESVTTDNFCLQDSDEKPGSN